jgi:PhoPQ-activated pathogenicity-related protein
MKRESLNSNETQLNDDMLIPLVDDMLICRQEMIESLNNKYGLNITVELSDVWANNVVEAIEEPQQEEPQQEEPTEEVKEGEEIENVE